MQSDCLIFKPSEEEYKKTIKWDLMEDELKERAMFFFKKYSSSKGPFFAFKLCRVEKAGEENCLIDGKSFSGKAMKFLEEGTEVAVYVASCGSLDGKIYPDPLDSFFSGTLLRMACDQAYDECFTRICSLLGSEVCSMNPGFGNMGLWPVSQLKGIFEILGNALPVRLSDSGLMIPVKSRAGLFFKSKNGFKGCMYCGRENCKERKLD